MYAAKVIRDSYNGPANSRITTIEVEYPHAVHKDVMTHRIFSRNFQSFRAFPPERVIERVRQDPFQPDAFRARVQGMGEGEGLTEEQQGIAELIWKEHVDHCLYVARKLNNLGAAKAQVNFPLQDLSSIKGIITATDWDNFWALRARPDNVRPEVKRIAMLMEEAYRESNPQHFGEGAWHLPYVTDEEIREHYAEGEKDDGWLLSDQWKEVWSFLKMVSAGRCARISYLTHDGRRDQSADFALAQKLILDGHMSPFEHQARPWDLKEIWAAQAVKQALRDDWGGQGVIDDLVKGLDYSGNLRGWRSLRKELPHESNYMERSYAAHAS